MVTGIITNYVVLWQSSISMNGHFNSETQLGLECHTTPSKRILLTSVEVISSKFVTTEKII